MPTLHQLTLAFFSAGMFINGTLFIPQAFKILQKKSAKDISLIMFFGFCFIQLTSVLYGYVHEDFALMWGMGYSFLTCGITTCLAMMYRGR